MENVIGGIRNEVKSAGMQDTRENCWTFFIERVRKQLKVRHDIYECVCVCVYFCVLYNIYFVSYNYVCGCVWILSNIHVQCGCARTLKFIVIVLTCTVLCKTDYIRKYMLPVFLTRWYCASLPWVPHSGCVPASSLPL